MRLIPTRLVGALGLMAIVAAWALGAALHRVASARAAMHDKMEMIGNPHEYPDLAAAGHANVVRAKRLLAASRRTARRFDSLAKARALGYRIGRARRPGFIHLRKHGERFWGRKFDANAPQSLVFWCPSRGRCTLAIYMYRAPGGKAPSTWGDLLMWHRHGASQTASWMTHVWLLRGVRNGFATCAPAMALERDLGIRLEPYAHHVPTRPCTGEETMPGDSEASMPGM